MQNVLGCSLAIDRFCFAVWPRIHDNDLLGSCRDLQHGISARRLAGRDCHGRRVWRKSDKRNGQRIGSGSHIIESVPALPVRYGPGVGRLQSNPRAVDGAARRVGQSAGYAAMTCLPQTEGGKPQKNQERGRKGPLSKHDHSPPQSQRMNRKVTVFG